VVVEEVVVAVRVEVSAVELLSETEVGDKLQVVGLVGLDGSLVMEQARVTVPVKELPGVTVMVAVLPLLAPGAMERLPLLDMEKLVALVPLGFCQKSPQPARKTTRRGSAMTTLRVHPRSFITAPDYDWTAQAGRGAGSESQLRIFAPKIKSTALARGPPGCRRSKGQAFLK
jgi:hypothetical protein